MRRRSISAKASSHVGLVQRAVGAAHERRAQAVGVLVQRLQAVRLRAEEAVAEDVVGVAADLHDVAVRRLYRKAAGRLAQRAGAEVRLA